MSGLQTTVNLARLSTHIVLFDDELPYCTRLHLVQFTYDIELLKPHYSLHSTYPLRSLDDLKTLGHPLVSQFQP